VSLTGLVIFMSEILTFSLLFRISKFIINAISYPGDITTLASIVKL
jgi:hypothetical protein